MRARRAAAALLLLALLPAACAPAAKAPVARRAPPLPALPAMKLPPGAPALPSRRANATIARDYLDLAFSLESGRRLPVLSRFEGPITLATRALPAGPAGRDLDALLRRIRAEAGIAIRRLPDGSEGAAITVEFVPRAKMRRLVPNAACFVAPRIGSWREYRQNPAGPAQDWTTLRQRERVAIFIPSDVAPQEIRDCLHEEIAQSLGPINDLYRLKDSVFNDDNFRNVLTGFDMLTLRITYDRALHSGMPREEVARRLPAILARINPAGEHPPAQPAPPPSPRSWIEAIEAALSSRRTSPAALTAATRALRLARENALSDNRLAFSLYVLGRVSLGRDPQTALHAFAEAEALYRADPATRPHAAAVAVQLAAHALSAGQPERTIALADENAPVALQGENAALLATFLMLKAQALEQLHRPREARIVRLDALGWARYGLGSTALIQRRLAEIAALAPGAGAGAAFATAARSASR